MRVFVLCEFSGIVRSAFCSAGHDAVSVDLLPSEDNGPHIQGDLRELDFSGVDLIVAHPPCRYLAVSGARWFKERRKEQEEALGLVRFILSIPVQRIALENPVSVISTRIRRPDQIIEPWQYGHGEVKKTCLWLKGLPVLKSTEIVSGRVPRVHYASPGPDRWKERSRTLPGMALAMADQWGVV